MTRGYIGGALFGGLLFVFGVVGAFDSVKTGGTPTSWEIGLLLFGAIVLIVCLEGIRSQRPVVT